MRKIRLLEFPSNLGLKEPFPGKEPGVKKLPDSLRGHGLYDMIDPVKISRLDPPPYSMLLDNESGVRNADLIIGYAKSQAALLEKEWSKDHFILSVGGDCSILLGPMLALKKRGNYGLFFLDGHTDYMLPAMSSTKAVAGMDLAIVTGNGPRKLTDIMELRPYVKEKYVFCAGNREFDPDYVNVILHSEIRYFDINRLRKTGMSSCSESFLSMITAEKLDGFWIHLDLDVLDDEVMPAVDSRTEGGLSYNELRELLTPLLRSPHVTGMDMTILDPDLDPAGQYTRHFVHEFASILREAMGTSMR